jgi:S-adenosylmethionine:tRNA ribosyltransferase-isomerase
MRTADLDYELPTDRIAVSPAEPRDAARLMVVRRAAGTIEHRRVRDLPELGVVGRGDLMVVNQSRVLPARFEGVRVGTGGRVSGLHLCEPRRGTWRVLIEARGSLRPGETIRLADDAALRLEHRIERGEWEAALEGDVDTLTLLSRVGTPPLPPYIRRARRALHLPQVSPEDTPRYNTVYAREPGSVAAPTAGLHFTPDLLTRLDAMGVERAAVTLHVGLGTFAPVEVDQLESHRLHSEWTHVPAATLAALARARAACGRILAVGTTTVRTLESLPEPPPEADHTADTALMILPGFAFRYTDLLLTNFHLPRSTLMALVAALPGVGVDNLRQWYAVAIAEGYRFYSYGDAMLLA